MIAYTVLILLSNLKIALSQRYDPLRGEMVIKYGREFLEKYFPLKNINWKKSQGLKLKMNL